MASDASPVSPGSTPWTLRLVLLGGVVALGAVATVSQSVLGPRGTAALGLGAFFLLAAAASSQLSAVRWRPLLWGFGLQLFLAVFLLRFEIFGVRPGLEMFRFLGESVKKFLEFTDKGSHFVFGPLAKADKLEKAFDGEGFVFAFTALPTIIFVSAFFSVLYHFRILQWVVRILALGMRYLMGTSGAETLSAVANVFMGQTEAPLIVKPYVERMTRSELLALMAGGMATISGGVMAVFLKMGADPVAILATSAMAAPCGLYLSKLVLPETELPETHGNAPLQMARSTHVNVIDAAASGAGDGLKLALNIAAMLIAFLALLAMIDYLLGLAYPGLSLQAVFSWVFYPVAILMGVDAPDAAAVGDLLGIKLTANEFVAFVKLTAGGENGYHDVISPRSYKLATYALTGFANFSSIAIQLGGIGPMAPSRRGDLARLGGRALLVGFLATLVNAAVAGILIED